MIKSHWRRLDDGWEAALVVDVRRWRWFRLGAFYGTPPGSRIGLWRTRGGFTGLLRGINLRIGRRYVGPCLTLLAYTRPSTNGGQDNGTTVA